MRLPGSSQLAAAKRLLESIAWYQLDPHPEWVAWSEPVSGPLSVAAAQWIWFPEGNPREDAPVAKRYFRREFDIVPDQRLAGARLRVSCDDRCAVWLNGHALGELADWKTGREFGDLKHLLRAGRNTLAIEGENCRAPVTRNPAGLLCRLEIRFADGATTRVDSDDAWRVSKTATEGWQGADFDAHNWVAPILLGAYGCAPWGELAADPKPVLPLCAGAGDELRLVYLLEPRAVALNGLRPGTPYQIEWFNPVTGLRQPASQLLADAKGNAVFTPPEDEPHDWAAVIKRP